MLVCLYLKGGKKDNSEKHNRKLLLDTQRAVPDISYVEKVIKLQVEPSFVYCKK